MNRQQKINAALNPNTPTKSLELLATDEDYYVRYCVAQNLNTSTKSLELLATDKNPFVRYWVAKNPNRTEIVERLILMTESKLSTAAV
jgi:3-methyladenine DNA glycosylase AlkC